MDISDNDIHSLPEALCSLVNLVKFIGHKNILTDIPDTIKQLKHLTYLDLSTNPLQKIPEGCTQLLNVTELYLNDTYLEFLPANFGRLVKLRILELRENMLTTLPKSLSRLNQLQRLDLGQNDISQLPEVIGSLTELTELWIDANAISALPPMIGNLTKLNHLEASFNQIESISEAIGNCKQLVCLSLSTNDLRYLPDGIGNLSQLQTLKVDDNQLEYVPNTIGKLSRVEELIISQNYLVTLPSSVGLCRNLHTLNIDDNDIEILPKELGSCASLKILSAHGNRLTGLPAEIDHISNLAVINLTGNLIQNLPVSFMKLRNITALWLSENQNKPLIQLNQDTDPETGQRVLTNFMLPQLPDDGHLDNVSESGSFHASVWEEEHKRKSQVKWAGEDQESFVDDPVALDNKAGHKLRREPTPFPKEMRAMAKRVQKMRSKSQEPPVERKKNKERKESKEIPSSEDDNNVGIQIKEAKVTKPHASPILSERRLMSVYQDEKSIREQMELKQFEDLERSLNINIPNDNIKEPQTNGNGVRKSPDKSSRDSGVITPSDCSVTSPETEQHPNANFVAHRKQSDPLPVAPICSQDPPGVKSQPPPYHIAAEFSKQAKNFNSGSPIQEHSYENHQFGRDRKTSSDSTSDISTAPSSLQTIVRSPYQQPNSKSISQSRIATIKTAKSELDAAAEISHASNLRRVTEQLMSNPRTRQSVTGIPSLNSRPGSYASPRGSDQQQANSSLSKIPTPVSTSSRPSSQMSFIHQSSDLRSGGNVAFSPSSPTPNGADLTPRSITPASKISLESNGLLTTIEKACHSDDEGQSLTQPNYENISNKSKIPQRFDRSNNTSGSGDFISTSQFVMNPKEIRSSPSTNIVKSKIPSKLPSRVSHESKLPKANNLNFNVN